MNKDQMITRLAGLKSKLASEGVEHLAVFGSRARGDHTPESDLDILLDVVPGSHFSLLDLVGVQHIVEDEVGITTNPVMRRSLDDRFRKAIAADIIEVF